MTRVTDEMVEAALNACIKDDAWRSFAPEATVKQYHSDMRAALEAALAEERAEAYTSAQIALGN